MSTVRQKMIELLRTGEYDALALSQLLSIREKEVYQHLPHIAKSLAASGKRLLIKPYLCLSCGFSFAGRERLNRPGRCPRCRQTHIRMATYSLG